MWRSERQSDGQELEEVKGPAGVVLILSIGLVFGVTIITLMPTGTATGIQNAPAHTLC